MTTSHVLLVVPLVASYLYFAVRISPCLLAIGHTNVQTDTENILLALYATIGRLKLKKMHNSQRDAGDRVILDRPLKIRALVISMWTETVLLISSI